LLKIGTFGFMLIAKSAMPGSGERNIPAAD
jgi:hypothetical protein